jgi:hypothetical protein
LGLTRDDECRNSFNIAASRVVVKKARPAIPLITYILIVLINFTLCDGELAMCGFRAKPLIVKLQYS